MLDEIGMTIKASSVPEIVAYRRYMQKQRQWLRRLLRKFSGKRALIHRDVEENLRFKAMAGYMGAIVKAFEDIINAR